MKNYFLTCLFFASLSNAFALENGSYINQNIKPETPTMFRSVVLNSSTCKTGGFMVTFFNADSMNFCVGHEKNFTQSYMKCLGKEVGEAPLQICIGIKVPAKMISTEKVTINNNTGELTLNKRYIVDKELISDSSLIISNIGNSEIRVIEKVVNNKVGPISEEEYFFSNR